MELEEYEKERMIKKITATAVVVLFVLMTFLFIRRGTKGEPVTIQTLSSQTVKMDALKRFKTHTDSSELNICSVKNLHALFLCHYSWNHNAVDDNMVIYEINDSPKVEVKMVRFNIDILYIEQLSREQLEGIGHYVKGFALENAEVAGLKAIKVKAFSADDPYTRLLDYYFVRDQKVLYALMFSVNPRSEWDNYKFLFQRIVESFVFK